MTVAEGGGRGDGRRELADKRGKGLEATGPAVRVNGTVGPGMNAPKES